MGTGCLSTEIGAMISVEVLVGSTSTSSQFEECFKFNGFTVPVNDIADYLATVIISRVRRRYMKQQNADGSSWPMTKAAQKRLAGGYTWAKGGAFAPGGKKTGGNILFASGNMYHSIQLAKAVAGSASIRSDVPYAQYYMNKRHEIIGTNPMELTDFMKVAIERMI